MLLGFELSLHVDGDISSIFHSYHLSYTEVIRFENRTRPFKFKINVIYILYS